MRNKRGITLIEFVVSVALISIVMVFLFNLLVDVQYNSKNGNFAVDNQLNRAAIIRTIEDDFANLGLIGLTDNSTGDTLVLNFLYKNNVSKILRVTSKFVWYGDEKWSLKTTNNRTNYQTNCIPYQFVNHVCCTGAECETNACSDYFYVHLRIPVVIGRSIDNTIDDLDFFYVGKSSELAPSGFPTKSFLGYQSNQCRN